MLDSVKPAIPELPKNRAELNDLLKKDFTILNESAAVDAYTGGEYHPGGVALSILQRQCPYCQFVFTASRREGCFSSNIIPHDCPNCHFPGNVLNAILAPIKE
ncbi:MAG TPA: hypothetical protein ENI19_03180 [Candidatus Nealsonbacteria bacterium]|uniref:Uncharacterized protein n=1 Tax=marine sediment metagenome TaxID=412755 RepID=A0A0F9VRX1_9ZZZZ|nr:hypothetical protein [Candidatus Nealsonbacteria bacterium]HEB46682.1 hypothetical protein [Candidatus Nealsonbacteria bacterium]